MFSRKLFSFPSRLTSSYYAATLVQCNAMSSATTTSSDVAAASAELFSMKQYHKTELTNNNVDLCKRIERKAWLVIQQMSDAHVEAAHGKDLAELLDGWWYFGHYWDNGMDGPSDSDAAAAPVEDTLEVPVALRQSVEERDRANTQRDGMAPPRRSNPLDDVLIDF